MVLSHTESALGHQKYENFIKLPVVADAFIQHLVSQDLNLDFFL